MFRMRREHFRSFKYRYQFIAFDTTTIFFSLAERVSDPDFHPPEVPLSISVCLPTLNLYLSVFGMKNLSMHLHVDKILELIDLE